MSQDERSQRDKEISHAFAEFLNKNKIGAAILITLMDDGPTIEISASDTSPWGKIAYKMGTWLGSLAWCSGCGRPHNITVGEATDDDTDVSDTRH